MRSNRSAILAAAVAASLGGFPALASIMPAPRAPRRERNYPQPVISPAEEIEAWNAMVHQRKEAKRAQQAASAKDSL